MTATTTRSAAPDVAPPQELVPWTSEPGVTARRTWRLRLATCCAALVVLAFVQVPGRLVADTKLDLTADPVGFLARALHLWDPAGAFGQLQNQAYGYLFPMGPFFAVADVLGVPGWVAQRLWWSLVLVVAFLGVVRLCGALRIGTPLTRVVAGFAFALAPRMVTTLGAASVEAWPMALAPWVLLPLVRARAGGRASRAAAQSALVVVCVGGVNAVATGAVLVLPTLWLLLADGMPRRWRLAAWWFGLTTLATVWWWGPLLLLGGYSPPFLDWIEDASVTTGLTSLVEALRGTSHWLAYLGGPFGPEWPAGWQLVSRSALVVDTALVAGLGLVGLARRDLPHRRFALAAVLVGLGLITAGHVGPHVAGPAAEVVRGLLDGPLAPARNVHKFDLVLRLPLVLGLAHVLARARLPRSLGPVAPRAAFAVVVVAVAGTAAPLLAGRAAAPGSYESIPSYWYEAADWLEANDDGGRALLVPGSSFGDYAWGRPRDEPLQALDSARWAVRDAVPLSSVGNIRMLDAIERRLAAGQGGAGLREVLQRAGVEYLVVRNDLDRGRTQAPRPVVLHQAIERTGLDRVAAFGPAVGNALETPTRTQDSRLDLPYPAVEVYRVGRTEPVSVRALSGSLRVSGAAEALLQLGDAGLLDDRAVLVGGDGVGVPDPEPVPVVTDTLRRRQASFGTARAEPGPVLRADDAPQGDRRVRDYLPVDDPARETVAVVGGVRDVTASSSGSDLDALFARGAEHAPWAAVDGDLGTSWMSGDLGRAEEQWLRLRLDEPMDVTGLQVALHAADPVATPVGTIVVRTDTGAAETAVAAGEALQDVAVPLGRTSTVTVEVGDMRAGPANGVGIREIVVPGVEVTRTLSVPRPAAEDTDFAVGSPRYLFRVADGASPACVLVGARPLCSPGLGRTGEEDAGLDRSFTLERASAYDVVGHVRARPGDALDAVLAIDDGRMQAVATSSAVADPFGRPRAAVDRDLGTGWVADAGDPEPRLELAWSGIRPVRGVHLLVDAALAAARPSRVALTVAGERTELVVDEEGYARLPRPVPAESLQMEVLGTTETLDVDPGTGLTTRLPAGVSEVVVLGADDRRLADDVRERPVGLACGWGPTLEVDGIAVPTRVNATAGDLLTGTPVPVRACGGPLDLAPGTHTVRLAASPQLRPVDVWLTPDGDVPALGRLPQVSPGAWGPTRRTVEVGAREEPVLLQVPENANAGWTATLDGRSLQSVRADGWSQGYVVPPGDAGTVTLVFAPDRPYRMALVAGGAGVLAVAGVLALAVRRSRPPDDAVPVGASGAPARDSEGSGPQGHRRPAAVVVLGALALVALGGSTGAWAAGGCLVTGVVVAFVPRLLAAVPWAAGAAVLVAGCLVAVAPWPRDDPGALAPAPQLLVLLGVGAAVLVPVVAELVQRRLPQRTIGAST